MPLHTSVEKLMCECRAALISLVPHMDNVKIPWRDRDAYDDWDGICQVLYHNMVVRSIQFSVPGNPELEVPRYGLIYPSYSGKSFISPLPSDPDHNEDCVFVEFSSFHEPLDSVRYQTVNRTSLQSIGKPKLIAFSDAKFFFKMRQPNSPQIDLRDLQVDL